MREVYCRRSCDRRYSGLRCDGNWVVGFFEIGAFECVICSMGAAGVVAAAATVLALRDAIRSSCGHRKACRRSDMMRTRGGILNDVW
jgi:hypothetical protein